MKNLATGPKLLFWVHKQILDLVEVYITIKIHKTLFNKD